MKNTKEYTMENLVIGEVFNESYGSWSENFGKFDINYSTILSKLIQEAGQHCERYASDLFIYWTSLVRNFENPIYTGGKYVFGFRENGIDHLEFVLFNLNNVYDPTLDYYKAVYKAVWMLEVEVEDNSMTMKLGKAVLVPHAEEPEKKKHNYTHERTYTATWIGKDDGGTFKFVSVYKADCKPNFKDALEEYARRYNANTENVKIIKTTMVKTRRIIVNLD